MSSQPVNPHDAVFRAILGKPANAASQLRAVLPQALVARLDLDQLTLVPGSLIDGSLRWRHTDLLFSAPLAGREAFIYVLIEHQSSTDPLMAFRMLRYVVRIWDRYLAEHPGAKRLPAVIPLVVHHSQSAWSAPVQVLDLLDLDPSLTGAALEYLPQFRFLLDDLVRLDDQALRERPLTPPARIVLLLLKIVHGNPRLVADLRRWAGDLRAVLDGPGGAREFAALLRYIELAGEAAAPDQLRDFIVTLGPKAEEAYVTIADMLRAEGRVETLIQQLTLKFGPLSQDALETVQAASVDQLQVWTARILTADTLDEVLR